MHSFNPPFWIGDRQFTADDLVLIKTIVAEFGDLSRKELAATVCENLPFKSAQRTVESQRLPIVAGRDE